MSIHLQISRESEDENGAPMVKRNFNTYADISAARSRFLFTGNDELAKSLELDSSTSQEAQNAALDPGIQLW